MTFHHATELAFAGAVYVVRRLGDFLVSSILVDLLSDGARALYRRMRPPPVTGLEGLEEEAERRRARVWAEVLAEAHSRSPERPDPDPHLLKLSRVPAP